MKRSRLNDRQFIVLVSLFVAESSTAFTAQQIGLQPLAVKKLFNAIRCRMFGKIDCDGSGYELAEAAWDSVQKRLSKYPMITDNTINLHISEIVFRHQVKTESLVDTLLDDFEKNPL